MPDLCNCFGRCCLNTVLSILSTLFFFTLGLIIGVVYISTFVEILPILIAAAVILALLFIIFLIIRNCNR